ncbi:uncharacterized protein LOC116266800 isoform X3 [Nymphaea colorata]|uniref:uncharacterized protein LOC116266800 isoform X3 n=1 Tax=Nymphaea colorata TaxID=210225 RepID=UPI00214F37BA|nr:uncharacterized protein LOC116266800 isoform X3 [Nymphaea colorata]
MLLLCFSSNKVCVSWFFFFFTSSERKEDYQHLQVYVELSTCCSFWPSDDNPCHIFSCFRSLIGRGRVDGIINQSAYFHLQLEFDWEAAVKEIDDACERVALASIADEPVRSVASENQDGNFRDGKFPFFYRPKSSNGARQSTLDGFVGSSKKFGDGPESSSRATMAVDDGENLYVSIDPETAKTWIYPGKIIFAAPSRPLVMQQIEACHNIVGIPQEWTIDMTGQMSPSKRSSFWETKRVFFVTPQVLEKDIKSGRCLVTEFVCLVIDEAHRAMGNYSYCTAVRELMAVPVQVRILALTATPGSKKHTVQNVIDNLQISVLEYRNESDNDVKKYMHDRQLELIEVAMSNDAVRINNLLLEAIQPLVSRLCALGVLQHRDLSTFSPCALLNSRDKFRQSPPANLPQAKYGEVEGYFGVLITLYYIHKLLSSHGTRPAYEMLQEKMQQGTFAKLMSRNEALWNAKMLMEKSLSHGAPNPKLLKMLEVLTDHFKTKDPQQSRVIIFSNYRGSVRDIMESLSSLGGFVKATEFIGQSSGKSLKGQSQKVQQAVLQKFRTGGYNVIVATSIGEEGLDIMEVDLVICFDANISPLRMIQRMGRTGRKHHGRVVILACQGNELKGYLNKQAKAKAVGKHMHNGGTNSFIFHSSPRMVPHIYKPEVQFVELSIEKFVPRGRKVKEDSVKKVPCLNMSTAETDLLTKYFDSGKEDRWNPSLIAFPHFQVFPSTVHHVRHSYRTTRMLIDSMQLLQEVGSFDSNRPISDGKVSLSGPSCVQAVSVPQANIAIVAPAGMELHIQVMQGCNSMIHTQVCQFPSWLVADKQAVIVLLFFCCLNSSAFLQVGDESAKHDCPSLLETKFDAQASVDKVSQHNFQQCIPGISSQRIAHHRFLFGTSFVSVTAVGSICISYVPLLPSSEEAAGFKISVPKQGWEVKTVKQEMTPFRAPSRKKNQNCDAKNAIGSHNFACKSPIPSRPDADKPACLTDIKEIVPQAPMVESKSPTTLIENATGKNVPLKAYSVMPVSDLKDLELSPRLTNLIERGVVPETPTAEPFNESSATVHVLNASMTAKTDGCSLSIDHLSPSVMVPRCSAKLFNSPECIQNPVSTFSSLGPCELDTFRTPAFDSRTGKRLDTENSEGVSDVRNMKLCGLSAANLPTPTEKHDSKSCSEEWQDIPTSVHQPCKLKRLRKYRDIGKSTPHQTMHRRSNEDGTSLGVGSNRAKSVVAKLQRGKMISRSRVNDFFDEEAEVSSDMDVSEDEQEDGEDPENNSFVDDRVNSTIATTQAEASETDMMAFYSRRSLLSQSPLECHLNFNGSSPIVTISEGHSLGTDSFEKSSVVSGRSINQSNSSNRDPCELEEGITSVNALASEVRIAVRKQTEGKIDMRKRKLDYQSVPSLHAADICVEGNGPVTSRCEEKCPEHENDTVFDDQFYEGLDLDEIEATAAEMLQRKSELTLQQSAKLETSLNRKEGHDLDVLCSPSFDLGV